METGAEIRRFSGFENYPQAYLTLAFSHDGRYVAAGNFAGPAGGDAKVIVWEAGTGKRLCQLVEPYNVHQLVFSPDSESLVIGAHERVRLVEPATGKVLREFPKETRAGVALDPTGKLLLTAGDKSIWDLSAGKRKFQWTDDLLYPGREAAWSPDGKTLATACVDHTRDTTKPILDSIVFWDPRNGARLRSFRPRRDTIRRLLFTPDGEHLLVSAHPATLEIWQVSTGLLRHEMSIPWDSREELTVFAVAGHGQLLAVQTKDESIQVWEVATGKRAHTLQGSYTRAKSLAFGHDGRTLISGHADGSALVWDLLAAKGASVAADGDKTWQDLATDPKTAYPLLWALASGPKPALELLRKHLKPAPPVDMRAIKEWIADLGDATFRKRENASARLQKLGIVTVPALRQELKKPLVLETQRRIEKILSVVDAKSPPADLLRELRAVQLLELIGDAPARQLLADLATGNPHHPTTSAASSAQSRLKNRD